MIVSKTVFYMPVSFRKLNKCVLTSFEVFPRSSLSEFPCTPKFLMLSFIFILSLSYFWHSSATCWTDSVLSQNSHLPDICLPQICKLLLNPQCPILIPVKIISSLRFLPVIFPVPTFCCILYKCLPFSSLSQLLCHFFIISIQIFVLASALLIDIDILYQHLLFYWLVLPNHLISFNPYICWHPCKFYLHPQLRNPCVTF